MLGIYDKVALPVALYGEDLVDLILGKSNIAEPVDTKNEGYANQKENQRELDASRIHSHETSEDLRIEIRTRPGREKLTRFS